MDKQPGQRAYLLETGVLYQIQTASGERHFTVVRDQKEIVLTTEEAMALVQAMESAMRKTADAVDDGIRRVNFNAEGGYTAN